MKYSSTTVLWKETVWEAVVNMHGGSIIQILNWNVNAARYVDDVLRHFVVPSVCRHLRRQWGHLSMTMPAHTGCLIKTILQAKFNDTNVMEWPAMTDYVSHWAFLWRISLSRARQGTIASICSPPVSNAYPEMKQYSTAKNSDCCSVNQASVPTNDGDRTDISNFAIFSTEEYTYVLL